MTDLNAIWTIAYRDLLKLLRDRTRLVSSLIFPFVFVAVLGPSFQASFGDLAGYNSPSIVLQVSTRKRCSNRLHLASCR